MRETVPVEIRVADLDPVKRLIAGAEKMATYEHAGGDGWWEGWAEVRAALRHVRYELADLLSRSAAEPPDAVAIVRQLAAASINAATPVDLTEAREAARRWVAAEPNEEHDDG